MYNTGDFVRKSLKNFFIAFKNIDLALKISFKASRKYFILKCMFLISTSIIPLFSMWIWKSILNCINNIIAFEFLMLLIAEYFLLCLTAKIIIKVNDYIEKQYNIAINHYFEKIIIDKTSKMDLAYFDSSSMADKLNRVGEHFWALEETTWTVFNIISEIINVIVSFVVVCKFNILIAMTTIFFMIPFAINHKKYMDNLINEDYALSTDFRKIDYLSSLFFDKNVHFEIKLNNTGSYFLEQLKKLKDKVLKINTKLDIKHNVRKTIISFLNYVGDALVLLISTERVIVGEFGVGDLQYNLSIVSRLREQFSAFIIDVNRFIIHNKRLNDLREFLAIKPEKEKSGDLIPSNINPKIEFCNVYFKYPNTCDYVLKNCSFTIEPNEKIGLIGLNGAGKSTIIKLMFRFYDPDQGCIKLNDIDIKEYNIYAVRRLFGVLFQDYVPYCLPLREVVALSDFDERFNDKKLKKVCDISGVTEFIKEWEKGFDSVLGRYYAADGKDLSGGQWQLLGLARAYFKECEYMVLDEPSAALDPISEDRIFEQLYQLSDGKTSITISHRLSNTVLADKILVIDDGHIIEQGSHDRLLEQNGKYAHLFNLQAEKYK